MGKEGFSPANLFGMWVWLLDFIFLIMQFNIFQCLLIVFSHFADNNIFVWLFLYCSYFNYVNYVLSG